MGMSASQRVQIPATRPFDKHIFSSSISGNPVIASPLGTSKFGIIDPLWRKRSYTSNKGSIIRRSFSLNDIVIYKKIPIFSEAIVTLIRRWWLLKPLSLIYPLRNFWIWFFWSNCYIIWITIINDSVTAAELQWHLPNMNIWYSIGKYCFDNVDDLGNNGVEGVGLVTSTPSTSVWSSDEKYYHKKT